MVVWHGVDDSKNGGVYCTLLHGGSHFFDVFLRQIIVRGVK
jgi:hypothetical protein